MEGPKRASGPPPRRRSERHQSDPLSLPCATLGVLPSSLTLAEYKAPALLVITADTTSKESLSSGGAGELEASVRGAPTIAGQRGGARAVDPHFSFCFAMACCA